MADSKTQAALVDLQTRDRALLRALFESRVMTTVHVAKLFFAGSKDATKQRLRKLKAAQLIGERARRVYEPSVLFLRRQAFALLQSEGILAEYPQFSQVTLEKRARVSDMTLRHELEVMDVKVAIHAAIREAQSRFSVTEFSTWPLLYQFEASCDGYDAEQMVKPDGFIRIHEQKEDNHESEHTFFLEVDRSTETQDTLLSRARRYFHYFHSGGFAERNGAPRSNYKDFPFRVLVVCKTPERRNNATERMLQNEPPILTQVWLSTFEDVTTRPLEAIWVRPCDYRDAVQGTPFDAGQIRERWGYQRQTAREVFVESKIQKRRLLES